MYASVKTALKMFLKYLLPHLALADTNLKQFKLQPLPVHLTLFLWSVGLYPY